MSNPNASKFQEHTANSFYGMLNSLNKQDKHMRLNPDILTGVVLDVNPGAYTCTVQVGGGRQIPNVVWASPWFNGGTGAGFSHRPEAGCKVVIARLHDTSWVIIGSVPHLKVGSSDSPEVVFKNDKPELNEGDISLGTDSGNCVDIKKDANEISVKNSEQCKITLSGLENLIRLYSLRLLIENTACKIDMNANSNGGPVATKAVFYKENGQTQDFVKITVGTCATSAKDIIDINVSNKTKIHITNDGKVELTCQDYKINAVGSIEMNANNKIELNTPNLNLNTTGNLSIKSAGAVQIEAGAIKETSGGTIIREAQGVIKDAGGAILHSKGGGKSPEVALKTVAPIIPDPEAAKEERSEPSSGGGIGGSSLGASISLSTAMPTPTSIGESLNNAVNNVINETIPKAADINSLSNKISNSDFKNLLSNPLSAIGLALPLISLAQTHHSSPETPAPEVEDALVTLQVVEELDNLGIPYTKGTITLRDSNKEILGSYEYYNGGYDASTPRLPYGNSIIKGEVEPEQDELIDMSVKDEENNVSSWKFIIDDMQDNELTGNIRTGICIHPFNISNKYTKGTIGILGTMEELEDFKKKLNELLKATSGNVTMSIIRNN